MWFEGGANCQDCWDNQLFYILFVRPTSLHVSGGSKSSATGVGLIPVMFPGSLTLHPLDPSYWNPTDHTNTFSLSAIKLIEVLFFPPWSSLIVHLMQFSRAHVSVKKIIKNNLNYNNLQVIKKYQTQLTYTHWLISTRIMSMSRSLNTQFIHQRFCNACHLRIL